MVRINILLIFFIFLFVKPTSASTYSTITAGSWGAPSVWSGAIAPSFTTSDTIIINHPILFNEDLYFESGAFMQIESNGGLCGHKNITVTSNALIIKYGILELDSMFLTGGVVECYAPGEVIATSQVSLSGAGSSFSLDGCALSVGPWFECRDFFDEAVGITELNTESFSVYPSPAKDFLNVNVSENTASYNLSIFNIQGRLIHHEIITGIKSKEIDISDLPKGIYILYITNSEFSKTKKFQKH